MWQGFESKDWKYDEEMRSVQKEHDRWHILGRQKKCYEVISNNKIRTFVLTWEKEHLDPIKYDRQDREKTLLFKGLEGEIEGSTIMNSALERRVYL